MEFQKKKKVGQKGGTKRGKEKNKTGPRETWGGGENPHSEGERGGRPRLGKKEKEVGEKQRGDFSAAAWIQEKGGSGGVDLKKKFWKRKRDPSFPGSRTSSRICGEGERALHRLREKNPEQGGGRAVIPFSGKEQIKPEKKGPIVEKRGDVSPKEKNTRRSSKNGTKGMGRKKRGALQRRETPRKKKKKKERRPGCGEDKGWGTKKGEKEGAATKPTVRKKNEFLREKRGTVASAGLKKKTGGERKKGELHRASKKYLRR